MVSSHAQPHYLKAFYTLDRALSLRSFACINLDQWANLFGDEDFVLQSANANANVTFFTRWYKRNIRKYRSLPYVPLRIYLMTDNRVDGCSL